MSYMLHPNGGMWLDMVNSDSVECNIYSGGSKTAGKEDNCNKTMHSLYDVSGSRLFGLSKEQFGRVSTRKYSCINWSYVYRYKKGRTEKRKGK